MLNFTQSVKYTKCSECRKCEHTLADVNSHHMLLLTACQTMVRLAYTEVFYPFLLFVCGMYLAGISPRTPAASHDCSISEGLCP